MRACAFASIATMTAVGWLFFACGGGQPPAKVAPEPASSSSAATASSAAPAASGGDTAPSTTLAVGPASSGTKLEPTSGAGNAAGGGDDNKRDGGAKRQSEPGRTNEDIRVLVMAHRDEARACYDAALPAHPGIEGDVTMKFTIDPEGTMSEVGLDPSHSTILEPGVATCIGGVLKKIKFAKSAKGFETHGHYPFNFHPKQGQLKARDGG